jgi:hypothetical protein
MNAASVDIKDMLEAESSLELTYTTNLFIGVAPFDTDNCVTVVDTPSGPPHLALSQDYSQYYYDNIQVTVRNRDYLEAMDLARDIMVSLHARAHEVWSSTYYSVIFCTNGPANMGQDENDRSQVVVNFQIQRR